MLEAELNACLVLFCYSTPIKIISFESNKKKYSMWISQEIISIKRMTILSSLIKNTVLMSEMQIYISRNQMLYRRVLQVPTRRENDKYVCNVKNRMKAVLQVTS